MASPLHRFVLSEFLKIFTYSFIYFLSCTGSLWLHRFFSSCGEQGQHSSREGVWASRWGGFSCCKAWALG